MSDRIPKWKTILEPYLEQFEEFLEAYHKDVDEDDIITARQAIAAQYEILLRPQRVFVSSCAGNTKKEACEICGVPFKLYSLLNEVDPRMDMAFDMGRSTRHQILKIAQMEKAAAGDQRMLEFLGKNVLLQEDKRVTELKGSGQGGESQRVSPSVILIGDLVKGAAERIQTIDATPVPDRPLLLDGECSERDDMAEESTTE